MNGSTFGRFSSKVDTIMAWHPFREGGAYPRDEVVRVCEAHIADGLGDGNAEQKTNGVEVIRLSSEETIVFSPFGGGWGRSPMNPEVWKTPTGKPIWER